MRPALPACALILAAAAVSAPAAQPPVGSVARIIANTSGGRRNHGTAFLIRSVQVNGATGLYFVTAAHLFAPEPEAAPAGPVHARVVVEAGAAALEIGAADILIAPGGGLDLAILRATAAGGVRVAPVPTTVVAPAPGNTFVIVGFTADGARVALPQRVRFRSTRFVMGDRTAPDVDTLVGAPALAGGAAFGFVTTCGPSCVPVVTLLEPAAGFIARTVPGWGPQSSGTASRQECTWGFRQPAAR